MPSIKTVLVGALLLKGIVAGPHHRHLHKRVLDVITDIDIVYDTVTDIVWVTVTDENGVPVATTTSPAAVDAIATTSSVVIVSVAPTTAAEASVAAAITPTLAAAIAPTPAAPIASSPSATAVASSVAPSTSVVPAPQVQTTLATFVAPTPSAASTSVAAASAFSTAAAATTSVIVASTSSTAAAAATASLSSASTSGSKRGLSYNDASLLDLFSGSSTINWCYNWGSVSDGDLPSGFEYVPMLWDLSTDATDDWLTNAKSAIADGSTYVLSFNEPDNSAQADLTPAVAAAGHIQYMNPLKGMAQIGAPAVTNGGGSEGLTWLEDFIDACNGQCDFDFVPIHWYDSATNYAYFKSHIEQAYVAGGNRTLWITEFGATGTTAEQVEFLQVVMPWLDEQDYVGRYAYFMDDVGVLLSSVSELSELGSTFADYTSNIINSLIADV